MGKEVLVMSADLADRLFEESIKDVYSELTKEEKVSLSSGIIVEKVHTRYREYLLEANEHLAPEPIR